MASEKLIDCCVVVDPKYQVNWHHERIAEKLETALERVLRGEKVRIILEVPPRHGKSELATIKFPAWCLGKHPELPIIVASYSADLANDFGLKTRDLMDESNYQVVFDTRLRADVKARGKWLTEEGGGYTATGIGGSFTGKGFKIGVIDDPIKNREEAESEVYRNKVWNWYRSTFYTRQDGAGAIIIIITRWHLDDLVGRLLAQQKEAEKQGLKNYDKWEVIRFPAIADRDGNYRKAGDPLWPERFPLNLLEGIKNTIGLLEWCTPAETPIIMGDYQVKKIIDIREGETVVGFQRGDSGKRSQLIPTKVIKKGSRIADVYELRMASGRKIRCTLNHKWYTGRKDGSEAKGNYKGRKEYDTPKIGRKLMYTGLEKITEYKNQNLFNYFAGIVDGEGHISKNTLVICQSKRNLDVIKRIDETLKELNINFLKRFRKSEKENWNDCFIWQIRDSKQVYLDLLRRSYTAKKEAIIKRMYDRSHMSVIEKDRILDIKKISKQKVYSLKTQTGNYIAWGYISSNSALYQQEPISTESQEFKKKYFTYYDEGDIINKKFKCTTTIDPAISQEKEGHNSVVTTVGKEEDKPEWYIREESAGKLNPRQLIDLVFYHREKYRSEIWLESIAYQKSLKYWLEEEMKTRGEYFIINELKANRKTNKEIRIRGLLPMYEMGLIKHKHSMVELENEEMQFPKGIWDDRVDNLASQLEAVKGTIRIKKYIPSKREPFSEYEGKG